MVAYLKAALEDFGLFEDGFPNLGLMPAVLLVRFGTIAAAQICLLPDEINLAWNWDAATDKIEALIGRRPQWPIHYYSQF